MHVQDIFAAVPMPMDVLGRPSRLVDRLAALCAMSRTAGLAKSPAVLQTLAWWDDALSPVIGCSTGGDGFVRTREGPRSPAVQEIVERWMADDLLRRDPRLDPDLSALLHADEAVVARGAAAETDVQDVPCFLRLHEHRRPWWNLMSAFVDGLMADPDGRVGVSRADPERDVRILWEYDTKGRGRSMTAAMVSSWKSRLSLAPASPAVVKAASEHAQGLALFADLSTPGFGDAAFLAVRERMRARLIPGTEGCAEEILLDGAPVARLFHAPADLRTTRGERRLAAVWIAPDHLGDAAGEAVLRHAVGRGCRRMPPPPQGGEALWGRHAHQGEDGSWTLCAAQWSSILPFQASPPSRDGFRATV